MSKVRLAWLATHPFQYQAPLLRAISKSPDIDLTALFFSDFSTRNYVDTEFGRTVEWDVPLLDGYQYEFLPGTGGLQTEISFFQPRISGLKERLTRDNFDAVLVQGWNHYGYLEAVWRSKRAGLKVLMRCEATDHVKSSTGVKGIIREECVKRVLSYVDQILAIGTRNREFFVARGVPSERIGSMPYCVDNDFFREQAKEKANSEQLRTELGLEKGRPVILYASKLTSRKNADQLLAAYSNLLEPRPYFLIVGDGELKSGLEKVVKESGLSDVRFLGFRNQSELPSFYALADIFVLPSVDETWGLVVNEAMNAGCAIIVSDQVGSGVDLVEDGVNGYTFKAGDISELAEVLSKTLDRQSYVEMGDNSAEKIGSWGIGENIDGLRATLNAVGLL